jgi:hypothetical protein
MMILCMVFPPFKQRARDRILPPLVELYAAMRVLPASFVTIRLLATFRRTPNLKASALITSGSGSLSTLSGIPFLLSTLNRFRFSCDGVHNGSDKHSDRPDDVHCSSLIGMCPFGNHHEDGCRDPWLVLNRLQQERSRQAREVESTFLVFPCPFVFGGACRQG